MSPLIQIPNMARYFRVIRRKVGKSIELVQHHFRCYELSNCQTILKYEITLLIRF